MEQQFWKKVAPMHEVGTAVTRVDALDKVKGTAKYTDDLCPKPCLVARLVHAQIANGWVREIDTTEAEAIPGVVAVFTYKDVPVHRFPTTTACASTATTSPSWWPRTTWRPTAACAPCSRTRSTRSCRS